MALPSGISTCTVTLDAPVSAVGGTAGRFVNLVVSCDRKLVVAATGTPLYPDGVDVTPAAAGDPMTVTVPHVDQPGFVDETGSPVTGWCYTLAGYVQFGSGRLTRLPTRDFQVLAGQPAIDLDEVPSGRAVPAVTAPASADSLSHLVLDPDHAGFFKLA